MVTVTMICTYNNESYVNYVIKMMSSLLLISNSCTFLLFIKFSNWKMEENGKSGWPYRDRWT